MTAPGAVTQRTPPEMNYDIGDLLNDWPFNPDEFTARRIRARDGSEKIQIRIDMGVLQLELQGRPDGQRPHDSESLLEYYTALLENEHGYVLDEEECEDLFQEAWQYYHRYLSLFYLEDYAGVERDAQHTLDLFALVQEHAAEDEIKWYFEQYYPHAVMMQTRSRAMVALDGEDYPAALRHVEDGIGRIERFVEEWEEEEGEEELPELAFLRDWHEELEEERPLSQREQLERDLRVAVEAENFEEAARLRDKLQMMWGPRRLFRPERPERPEH
ncbi:MAG: UvrB/UvrC motif-containing protein [Candidatus Latescibacterota bacterium]